MDLNNIGGAEDRISELPDSILHYILSFAGTKCAARTCILSSRWNSIWTSIPALHFHCSSGTDKFMDFVDRTLLLRDTSSNIKEFSLDMGGDMSASRVHSWISNVTKRKVEELTLCLDTGKPVFIPFYLFACESLVKLELIVYGPVDLPKRFSLPKLKSLTLQGIQFTGDDCWSEQHFSNCPVLEDLILRECTWFGVRNICISIPTLEHLEIDNDLTDADGLKDCALKIHAPHLVSVTYRGSVAEEYVLSSFQTLQSARIVLWQYDVPISEQQIGAAVRQFFQGLSHVQSLTISLETPSVIADLVSILPMLPNLVELFLELEYATDNSVIPLLKAARNLTHLVFKDRIKDSEEEDSWAGRMSTSERLFQHLRSVGFVYFSGKAREMRWLKLILKNAKALQKVTIGNRVKLIDAKTLMAEFPSLPKASDGCLLEIL